MKKIIIQCINKLSHCHLQSEIFIDGSLEIVNIEVNQEFGDFLVIDRIDSLVWGLLHFAVSNGYDIESDLPITEDLWYNLEYNFIDTLATNPGNFRISICAPLVSAMPHKSNIVGTGISCGVDSLYTIASHEERVPIPYRITHLCFFDAGSHDTGKESDFSNELYMGRLALCRRFAEEYEYGFIQIKNDLYKLIDKYAGYSHIENHTFMALSCIYAIQQAFSKYYYSAGISYHNFSCTSKHPKGLLDSAYYDLLTLHIATIPHLKFISAGGAIDRISKTKIVASYKPAMKYLNVCVNSVENDSSCFKCIRTMLTLDALGCLERFRKVFNVDYYKAHRKKYIEYMYIEGRFYKDASMRTIFPLFESELTLYLKLSAIVNKLISTVKRRIL